jgi:hypothetical protein
VETEEAAMAEEIGGIPPELLPALVGMWGRFHGLVMLEVTGQLHWLYPDPGTFFAGEVTRMVDELQA